jgi:spore maturation protein CgeB
VKKIQKILVVGFFSSNSDIYTYSTSFFNTFKQLGYTVEKFDYRQAVSFVLFKNFFMNFLLRKKVKKFEPDLIFFVKAENILPKTLRKIKKEINVALVNFYPDNPFVFWNGNSNANVLNSLSLYDCFLIWSKMLMPVLKSAGCKNVYYFPFAFDQDLFCPKIDVAEYELKRYSCDVCFIGTWDKEREIWLTELCQKLPELNLGIWGNLWVKKLSSNSILLTKLRGSAIYGQEMQKAFACSKIVLNFIRKQNITSHNMRTFEVTASKSFLLTERTLEQAEQLFLEGENIECFGNIEELVNKVDFYLNNDKHRSKIAEHGFERAQNFKITSVLQEFMKHFQSNFETRR